MDGSWYHELPATRYLEQKSLADAKVADSVDLCLVNIDIGTQYVLGTQFLNNFDIGFDMDTQKISFAISTVGTDRDGKTIVKPVPSNLWWIIIIVVVAVIAAGLGYYFHRRHQKKKAHEKEEGYKAAK